MTYGTGNIIDDGDYNTFATGTVTGASNHSVQNLNTLWSGGSTNRGYGQAGAISAVTPGSIITATQWSTLFNRMDTIASHQATSITSITNPTVGDEIAAYNAFVTNLNSIWNSRLNCGASGTPVIQSTNRTGSWLNQVNFTKTVTWNSSAERRYFFNTGGTISLAFSRSGGTVNATNTEWTDLLNKAGTLRLTGATPSVNSGNAVIAGTTHQGFNKLGGSGTPATLASGIGFYETTTSNQLLFQQFADTAPYGTNNIQVYVRRGTNSLIFTVIMKDNDSGTDPDNTVNGTLNCTMSYTPPSTAYISNSWGSISQSGSQTGS
jgi:hypothetical protein